MFAHSDAYVSACKRIQDDANFQPNITADELLDLVVDENDIARHRPRRTALALQSVKGISGGMLFKSMTASKRCKDPDSEYAVWGVDSMAILVNRKGEYSFFTWEDAEKDDFTCPLTHLNIDDFLDKTCFHKKSEDKAVESVSLAPVLPRSPSPTRS